ncbi:Lrp/AsnC ligand binding domain-containing protein [Thermoproteota archaeon]
MATAFVLLNAELGQGTHVEKSLKDITEVKEVFAIYGVYDYIVKLETESISELKDIIASKMRQIDFIRSTLL